MGIWVISNLNQTNFLGTSIFKSFYIPCYQINLSKILMMWVSFSVKKTLVTLKSIHPHFLILPSPQKMPALFRMFLLFPTPSFCWYRYVLLENPSFFITNCYPKSHLLPKAVASHSSYRALSPSTHVLLIFSIILFDTTVHLTNINYVIYAFFQVSQFFVRG